MPNASEPQLHHELALVLVGEPGIIWSNALALAQSKGGYLATITSAAENAFVYQVSINPALWRIDAYANGQGPWLGGYQTNPLAPANATWAWVSGEPWNYTHWNSGEPNDFNGNESCLVMEGPGCLQSSGWNDLGFGVKELGYVVEYDGPLSQATFSASNLPPFLTLSASGVISGTPPYAGLYTNVILFVSTANGTASNTVAFYFNSYDAWRRSNFTPQELTNALICGPTADPDGDGLANLGEYFVNCLPKQVSPEARLQLDQNLNLHFRRSRMAPDMAVQVQTTESLQPAQWSDWLDLPSDNSQITVASVTGVTEEVVAPIGAATSGSAFARLAFVNTQFADTFTNGIDSLYWTPFTDEPQFTIQAVNGQVSISKPAGGNNIFESAGLRFNAQVIGDFDVSICFTNALLTTLGGGYNQIQLNATFGNQYLCAVRETGSGYQNYHVWANPPASGFGATSTTANAGKLRLKRIGSAVCAYFNDQMFYEGVYNNATMDSLSFTLQNNGSATDAISVTFGNFQLTADAINWN